MRVFAADDFSEDEVRNLSEGGGGRLPPSDTTALEVLWSNYTDPPDPKDPTHVQHYKSVEMPLVDLNSGGLYLVSLAPDGKRLLVTPVVTTLTPQYEKGVTFDPVDGDKPDWHGVTDAFFPGGFIEFNKEYMERLNPTTVPQERAASADKSEVSALKRALANVAFNFVSKRRSNPYAK